MATPRVKSNRVPAGELVNKFTRIPSDDALATCVIRRTPFMGPLSAAGQCAA
jgi:hypothetical protein